MGVSNYAWGTVVDDGLLYSRDTVKGMDLTCFYGKAVTLLLLPNFSYSMMDMNTMLHMIKCKSIKKKKLLKKFRALLY